MSMRLSDENTREGKHLTPEERIALQAQVYKEIKQLQQESNSWQNLFRKILGIEEQLQRYDELDAGHSRLFKDFCIDEIIAREKQIEQLQIQAARMWEALRKARKALHKGISELKVHCKYFDQTPEEDICIEMHEAIIEIDKAIGGGKDE